MSGYVVLTTTCGVCGQMFHCNPNRVPSKDNQAFCRECVEAANLERVRLGMDAHPIHPEAYKPLPEQQLR